MACLEFEVGSKLVLLLNFMIEDLYKQVLFLRLVNALSHLENTPRLIKWTLHWLFRTLQIQVVRQLPNESKISINLYNQYIRKMTQIII